MFLLDLMPHLLTFTVVYLKNIIYYEILLSAKTQKGINIPPEAL